MPNTQISQSSAEPKALPIARRWERGGHSNDRRAATSTSREPREAIARGADQLQLSAPVPPQPSPHRTAASTKETSSQ